jgi:hypothetical protein
MATAPQVIHQADPNQPPPKAKRKRTPSVPKPAFFIIQVLDEQGNPMQFDKKRIKLLSVQRDAEKTMELTEEGGPHPHAFYLRGIVPVTRQAAPRQTTAAAA